MSTRATDTLGRTGAPRRGFTLMELLIAVGALAFIAVGVAAIFDATGRTIRAGRRVSDFTAYANLIEQQMRADIQSMTREGFLIIRNEYADADGNGSVSVFAPGVSNPDAVPLYEGEPASQHRLRRIDELMFFAKGQFASLREPLDSRFIPRADAAAIYYGHGQRRVNDAETNPTSSYLVPQLDDNVSPGGVDRNARLGYRPASRNVTNPNRFASDWILVRRVTLLRPPSTSLVIHPSESRPFGLSLNRMADSDIQIGLQPAASSIFRSLASRFPLSATQRVRFEAAADHPQIPSGLVDIATTDLGEIRLIVTTADCMPGDAGNDFYDPAANTGPEGNNAGVDGLFDARALERMQAWMLDALPAFSHAGNPNDRTRIRCESAPTNFVGLGAQFNPVTNQGNPTYLPEGLERAYRRADQLMLSSSNFLPHCTEFIVEWSFGDTWPSDPDDGIDRDGEIVWHGMRREANGRVMADCYRSPFFNWVQAQSTRYRKVDGTFGTHIHGGADPDDLIHGVGFDPASTANNPREPLVSYFGYVDPTFDPDTTGDGKLDDPADATTTTLPWPWPKLLRITLSLADPNDPSIEQSFQFIFEVPSAAP